MMKTIPILITGIKNVKKIVAKYKGAYDMECEDDEVVTTVTMLYK